jgi:nanoRNase/pAp phosphatase (c-di-AMP/oligoRNAs hydrolase)
VVDCNLIAKYFGGGGHKPAAGFSLPMAGKLEDQMEKIVKEIGKMIK